MPHEICTITECGECMAEREALSREKSELLEKYQRRVEKLEAVAMAAANLIYVSRSNYKPGSKKAALRDALEALKS